MNYVTAANQRRRRFCSYPARPSRGGAMKRPSLCLPSTSSCSQSISAVRDGAPDARPLHARQHRQRPGPLHPSRDRAADHRQRPLVRRRPLGLAVGVRQARSGAPPSTRTRRCSPRRSAGHGPGIRQCIGPMFDLWSTYLGDQWSIGAWDAMREAAPDRLPEHMPASRRREPPRTSRSTTPSGAGPSGAGPSAPPATTSGCSQRQGPAVLLTHHMRAIDEPAGSCSAPCPTSRPSG